MKSRTGAYTATTRGEFDIMERESNISEKDMEDLTKSEEEPNKILGRLPTYPRQLNAFEINMRKKYKNLKE